MAVPSCFRCHRDTFGGGILHRREFCKRCYHTLKAREFDRKYYPKTSKDKQLNLLREHVKRLERLLQKVPEEFFIEQK